MSQNFCNRLYYLFRIAVEEGGPWQYGDLNGSPDGIQEEHLGELTVNVCDTVIDWCSYAYPNPLSTYAGLRAPVRCDGNVRIDGITDISGAAPLLEAELGYGPVGVLPTVNPSQWTWTPAVYEQDYTGFDRYDAFITPDQPGTYYMAFRFRRDGGEWLYGDLDGSANGVTMAQMPLLVVYDNYPCDHGWAFNPETGKSYTVTTEGLTWSKSEEIAAEMGGHLVTIMDENENEWLRETFGNWWMWIGLTDIYQENSWVWISGESSEYRNWFDGEPTTGEHFAFINYNGGRWANINSSIVLGAIIERIGGGGGPYCLNITSSHGNVARVPFLTKYPAGSEVQLTPTPFPGYVFVSWSGDVPEGHETDNPLLIVMDANKTVEAHFDAVLEGEEEGEPEGEDEGEEEGEVEGEAPVPHPADLNADWRIAMSEAIAYLAGWQQGTNPIGHAIRAAYLWQNGEQYIYDPETAPPLCWVLAGQKRGLKSAAATEKGSARCVLEGATAKLMIVPAPGTTVWGVEQHLAEGLTVMEVTGSNSTWDPVNRKLSWWGLGDTSAQLAYTVAGLPGIYPLTGETSFDGAAVAIDAPDTLQITPGSEDSGAGSAIAGASDTVLTEETTGETAISAAEPLQTPLVQSGNTEDSEGFGMVSVGPVLTREEDTDTLVGAGMEEVEEEDDNEPPCCGWNLCAGCRSCDRTKGLRDSLADWLLAGIALMVLTMSNKRYRKH